MNCVCPTYNRPPHYQRLLEEAIASFLRQDHPNKELIALDGCLGQELTCDGPKTPPFQVTRSAWLLRTNHPAWLAILKGRHLLAKRLGVASIQSREEEAVTRRIGGHRLTR